MLRIFLKARSALPTLAAVIVMFVASPAWALTTGSLRVTVVDDDMGLEIPGVQLVLTGDNLMGGAQERLTDMNGQFKFVELLPGTYRIQATKAGFGGVTLDGIRVNVNSTTNQEVVMSAGKTEEVEVIAKQKTIDTESTARKQVLTKEFLSRIPTGRSYQSAVQTTSGVTGGGGNPNMGGGSSNENTYMLDGANITDPVTGTFSVNFNFDAIQQIEVLLGGYMPEYGVSVGGIINVVTESGSNNLKLNTNVYYLNGNLRPRMDARLTADGLPLGPTGFDTTSEVIRFSSKVSGPIVRDKAWFIFSYSGERSIIANTGIPQTRDYEGHYLLTKLTVQPSTEHRLSAFIQTDPTTIDNIDQGDPYQKPESQGRQSQGGFISQLRWQWFLSPEINVDSQLLMQKSFIEVNAVPCTHNRSLDYHPCRAGEVEGDVDWETPGRMGISGAYNSVNYGYWYFDDRYRYTANSKLSVLSIEDPLGGSHDFKFGIEGVQLVWDQAQGYAGNTLYYDINAIAYDPQSFVNYYWLEITGPIKFRTTASQWNVFAQDSWKPVSNLTINYGSRFDSFVMRNDLGEPVLSGGLLGPRLFAAWDPWGDQKTKIATGYGRFNDTGRLGVASFTSANSYGSKLFFGGYFPGEDGQGYLNTTNNMYDIGPKRNLNTSHDNLRTPSVDEVLLTLEREVVEDVMVFSSMSNKFTRYMYEFDETNLIYDSDGSTVIGSRLADPLNPYFRMRTPLLAKRDFLQWDLGLRKVLSRRWQAGATYTYMSSIGSTSTANSGSFAIDPQSQYNYGPLLTNLSQVKASGFWDLPTDPWKQTIGFFFNYESGYNYERLYYSESPYGGQFGSYNLRIQDRGIYTNFGGYWFLSLKFQQDIDVRKGKFIIDLTALNITNNRAPRVPYTYILNQQNRMLVGSRQSPMQFQAGLRYEF